MGFFAQALGDLPGAVTAQTAEQSEVRRQLAGDRAGGDGADPEATGLTDHL